MSDLVKTKLSNFDKLKMKKMSKSEEQARPPHEGSRAQ